MRSVTDSGSARLLLKTLPHANHYVMQFLEAAARSIVEANVNYQLSCSQRSRVDVRVCVDVICDIIYIRCY